ncbi:MAG: hypothetical protein GX844_07570 [Alcaligenaceae bacterium]|nr:hypothetical protein [Alcaligenaceae bacterium]
MALVVDLAVPVGFSIAVGAHRLAHIRVDRIKLVEHEAVIGSRLGSHTISKHIGKSEKYLLARMDKYKRLKTASTFYIIKMAEDAISEAVRVNRFVIEQWAKSGVKRTLGLDYVASPNVGFYINRASKQVVYTYNLELFLNP